MWYSPAPPKKRKKEFETEIQQPTSEDEQQLTTTSIGQQSEHYTSPVENLVRSKEEQIRKQEALCTTCTLTFNMFYIKIQMCNNNNYYNFIYLGRHITVQSW